MPLNENQRVTELLSWHGHDRGGVHVPFQSKSKPLLKTIETSLVTKLRSLAHSIAQGDTSKPRWIFLIGGPGNGKSETVQDFLDTLDNCLGMQGALTQFLSQAFAPQPIVRRRVTVTSNDIANAPGSFSTHVRQLIIVQDATATEDALGNAAKQFAEDIADLLTTPDDNPPVFVACANRGLLTRALREAHKDWGSRSPVAELLTELIRSSSLGSEVLSENRHSCWPLAKEPRAACWPLDFESLLASPGTGRTAVQQIFDSAIDIQQWEVVGRCLDCTAGFVCPFRQNAAWLRDSANSAGLINILRRGELVTGQHWNFRDTFSLVAEIIVGQWSDFPNAEHPCQWVHQQAQKLRDTPTDSAISPTYSLLKRLYPHALFRKEIWKDLVEKYRDYPTPGHPLSKVIIDVLSEVERSTSKSIREKLSDNYARLDPAMYTPGKVDDLLRSIEESYSQSIELGMTMTNSQVLATVELKFLQILDAVEREWYRDLLGNNSVQAARFSRFLRRVAAIIIKRTFGVREGKHSYENYLEDFEDSLQSAGKLNDLASAMSPLLGQDKFRFNLVESFGQPRAEADQESIVTLVDDLPGIRFVPASRATEAYPGLDIPCLVINGKYRVAITFEFYLALRLRKEGCASSSLPASVRAAVDRIRHLYAGDLCRRSDRVNDNKANILIGDKFKINIDDTNDEPIVVEL